MKVSRSMHDSQNVNSIRERSIEYQHVLETCYSEDSQGLECTVPKP